MAARWHVWPFFVPYGISLCLLVFSDSMRLYLRFCVKVVRKALEWDSYMKGIWGDVDVVCREVEMRLGRIGNGRFSV